MVGPLCAYGEKLVKNLSNETLVMWLLNLAPTVLFIVQFFDSVAFGPYLAECDSVALNTSPLAHLLHIDLMTQPAGNWLLHTTSLLMNLSFDP